MAFVGTCKCSADDCLSWHKIRLPSLVNVTEGETYSFMLSGPQSKTISYRIGVSVADVYQRGSFGTHLCHAPTHLTSGSNEFPVPGYDYSFTTFMYRPAGAGEDYVDIPTTEDPLLNEGPHTETSASAPIFTIVGVIAGVVCVAALVVAAVVYKRRKNRISMQSKNEWMTVAEATAELKTRFAAHEAFSVDTGVAQYHRRMSASFESIPQQGDIEQTRLQFDNDPRLITLQSPSEPDEMANKTFVWDPKTNGLALVNRASDSDDYSAFLMDETDDHAAPAALVNPAFSA
jgi:hypothetical protein